MFTIKIIDNGIEIVKEVREIIKRPARETLTGRNCVTYYENNLDATDVYSGDIYLMNDNGKTIANYCLGHSPE
jgi:hypothetical protein